MNLNMENTEILSNNPNILMDYNLILEYCPYYFEIKEYLKSINFISKKDAIKYVEENYKSSKMYNKLKELAIHEEDIKILIKENASFKYDNLIGMLTESIKNSIDLCNLIEYIGNYPTTYPFPKSDELNMELEKLLERYDIIVRYFAYDDLNEMQITSDDISRIITTLNNNLKTIKNAYIKLQNNNEWLLNKKSSNSKYIEDIKYFKDNMKVPLSSYQKKGKSRRKEGLYYLRLQEKNKKKHLI